MSDCSPRIVLPAVALAAALAGGCLMGKPPPTPINSALFTSCKNMDALVTRAAAGAGCAVEGKGPWGSGGVGGAYRHDVAGLSCTVRGDREAAGKVLQAVQAEVQALAGQTGAAVIDVSEGKDAEGGLAGFEINYGAGGAHGKVEGKLLPAPARPGKLDDKRFQLRVQIEEWAG